MDDENTPPKLDLEGMTTLVSPHLYSTPTPRQTAYRLTFLARINLPTRRDLVARLRKAAQRVSDPPIGEDGQSRVVYTTLEHAMVSYPYQLLDELAAPRSKALDATRYLLRHHHGHSVQIMTGDLPVAEYKLLLDTPDEVKIEEAHAKLRRVYTSDAKPAPSFYITAGVKDWPAQPPELRQVRVQNAAGPAEFPQEDELIHAEETMHALMNRIGTRERLDQIWDFSNEYMTTYILLETAKTLETIYTQEPYRPLPSRR